MMRNKSRISAQTSNVAPKSPVSADMRRFGGCANTTLLTSAAHRQPLRAKISGSGESGEISGKRPLAPGKIDVRRFRDQNGNEVYVVEVGSARAIVPAESLGAAAAPQNQLARICAEQGVNLISQTMRYAALAKFGEATEISGVLTLARRPGWLSDTVFATEDGAIISGGLMDASFGRIYSAKSECVPCGNVEDAIKELGGCLQGQLLLQCIVAYALTPPLLQPFGQLADVRGNFGLQISGPSSKGKTTALLLGQSVWRSVRANDLMNWNVTDNGFESMMSSSSDTLFVIDDGTLLGADRQTRRMRGQAATMRIATGLSKRRLGESLPKTSNLVILSSTNDTQRSFLSSTENVEQAVFARMSELDISGRLFGILDHPGDWGPAETIRKIHRVAEEQGGSLGRAWLQKLTQVRARNPTEIESYLEMDVETFRSRANFEGLSSLQQRVCNQFALVFAAAHLALRYNLWPKNLGAPGPAIMACFKAVIRQSVSPVDPIKAFEDRLKVHRSRILNCYGPEVPKSARGKRSRFGIITRGMKSRIELLLTQDVVDGHLADIQGLLTALKQRDALVYDHGHNTTKRDVFGDGRNQRCYAILLNEQHLPGHIRIRTAPSSSGGLPARDESLGAEQAPGAIQRDAVQSGNGQVVDRVATKGPPKPVTRSVKIGVEKRTSESGVATSIQRKGPPQPSLLRKLTS